MDKKPIKVNIKKTNKKNIDQISNVDSDEISSEFSRSEEKPDPNLLNKFDVSIIYNYV